MEEEIQLYLDDARENMMKAVIHTKQELAKIRAGKAMPNMLDGLHVEYYGTMTPINQMATVNTPDPRTLSVKPFEKSMIAEIEKAIINSDLGLNPQSDGEQVRINIPPLTEERRINLMKQVKNEAETGKISIRNARHDTNNHLKQLQKDGGISEDLIKDAEGDVQKITDEHTAKIDELVKAKEADIMTV